MSHRVRPSRISGTLGSLGNAKNRLIRQVKFPDTYDERDSIIGWDHDRIQMNDWDHFRRVCQEHLGKPGHGSLSSWPKHVPVTKLMAFCADALKAGDEATFEDGTTGPWTGCRIMGTVDRSNGHRHQGLLG